MNEIQVALQRKAPYEVKLALFRKYHDPTTQGGYIQSLDVSHPNRQARETLDYQLDKLKWRKDIDSATQAEKRKHTLHHRIKQTYGIVSAYPPAIKKAVENRSRAANLRERAGRILVEKADSLSKAERADLISQQRTYHAVVVAETNIIDAWKASGKVPEAPKAPPPSLSPEKIESLTKERQYVMKQRSRYRGNLRKFTAKGDTERAEMYRKKMLVQHKRVLELNQLLGKHTYGTFKEFALT